MGMCLPCLGGASEDYDQPDPETRRRQAAEAAEKRKSDQDKKGIKDPEALKQKQKRLAELEKKQELAGNRNEQDGLKWQMG
ncbi:small VCP/p97-interacting protein-like [Tubulanus polymorphus]|uniref:small VCP/p97-interacting protein-like n=1 Tax=Tubulanus polymorphus TaxID=672921 RepID=UPI003DA2BFD1